MRTQMKLKVLVAATILAFAPPALADDASTGNGSVDAQVSTLDKTGASRGQAQVAARIASQFGRVAGSDANALALVNGLRNGTTVTLTSTTTTKGPDGKPVSTTTTTTIAPPTKPMGWGNVRIALALAQSQLQQAGITKPTAEQLQAALTGGTLKSPSGTTTQVQGVLTMRASGMGWGQIAHAQGTKLGPVLASLRHTQHEVAKLPVKGDDHRGLTTASGKGAEHEHEHEGKGSKTAASTTRPTSGTSPGGLSSKTTLVTGNGTSTTSHGHGSKGMTTANGATSSSDSSKGLTTASGATPSAASKGIVTAEGAAGGSHGAKSHGKGIVTAGGGAAVNTASPSTSSSGAGITTGTGASAAGTGVTTAQGGAAGEHGNGHGKGKGGG